MRSTFILSLLVLGVYSVAVPNSSDEVDSDGQNIGPLVYDDDDDSSEISESSESMEHLLETEQLLPHPDKTLPFNSTPKDPLQSDPKEVQMIPEIIEMHPDELLEVPVDQKLHDRFSEDKGVPFEQLMLTGQMLPQPVVMYPPFIPKPQEHDKLAETQGVSFDHLMLTGQLLPVPNRPLPFNAKVPQAEQMLPFQKPSQHFNSMPNDLRVLEIKQQTSYIFHPAAFLLNQKLLQQLGQYSMPANLKLMSNYQNNQMGQGPMSNMGYYLNLQQHQTYPANSPYMFNVPKWNVPAMQSLFNRPYLQQQFEYNMPYQHHPSIGAGLFKGAESGSSVLDVVKDTIVLVKA